MPNPHLQMYTFIETYPSIHSFLDADNTFQYEKSYQIYARWVLSLTWPH